MGYAAPCRHPVDLLGTDCLLVGQAVAMHDLACEQIGDRGEPNMRMRSNIGAAINATGDVDRPDMVEENEGAHHLAFCERQDPAYLETAAKLPSPLFDHQLDHCLSYSAEVSTTSS